MTRLELLEQFYKDVIEITVNHDVLEDSAVVFPYILGMALAKVNPKWYEEEQ